MANSGYRFLVSLLLASRLWGQSHDKPAEATNKSVEREHAVEAGKQLFLDICSACHGPNGTGGHGPSLNTNEEVHQASDQELFTLIHNGIRGTEMKGFALPENEIWQLVAFVRSLSLPAIESVIAGDVQAGRDIFFRGKDGCAACHMIRGIGGFPGPDLSDIGTARTVAQLRNALLRPSAYIRPGFRAVNAITRDGQEIQGVAKCSTNYSLDILDARGELHMLSTRDLKAVNFHDKSLMPDDYSSRLTPKDVEDLLAFLSRQSIRGESLK